MKSSTRQHPSYLRLRALAERVRERNNYVATGALNDVRSMIAARPGMLRYVAQAKQEPWVPRAARWTDEQRQILRARADSRYRRNLIRRLRAQCERLSAAPATLEAVHPLRDARRAYYREADRLDRALDITLPRPPAITDQAPTIAGVGREHWVGDLPHRAGWEYEAGYSQGVLADEAPHYVWRDGGGIVDDRYLPAVARDGRAEYVRADRRLAVRAYAVIASPQRLLVALGDRDLSIELDPTLAWGVDAQGLRGYAIESPRDDYHPDAGDLQRGAEHIRQQLVANRTRRLDLAAKRAAERAEAEGVWICAADSVRAGNCRAGTETWATQHELDPTRHYPATQVYDVGVANQQAGRVRLAITAAVIRHRREAEAGVCVLEEHTL